MVVMLAALAVAACEDLEARRRGRMAQWAGGREGRGSAASGSSGDSRAVRQRLGGRRRLCPVGQAGLCGALRKVGRLCYRACDGRALGLGSRG